MKKIGLLSDTHSYLDKRIFEYFADVDEIWHAGDVGDVQVIEQLEAFKPLIGVYGNIDGTEVRHIFPEHQYFECEGVKILMTHIAGKPYKYYRNAKELFDQYKNDFDLFICGHSHILKVQFDKNLQALWMNPGACGKVGFHKVKTILRFSIDGDKIKDCEVIELL